MYSKHYIQNMYVINLPCMQSIFVFDDFGMFASEMGGMGWSCTKVLDYVLIIH